MCDLIFRIYILITIEKKEIIQWNIDCLNKQQIFEKAEYGVKLVIPPFSIQDNQMIYTRVQIVDSKTSDIELPQHVQIVSSLYDVHCSGIFSKPVELHLQHHVNVMSQNDIKRLAFIICDGPPPYHFKISDDEQYFGINDNFGLIKVSHFTVFGIVWLLNLASKFLQPICSYTMTLFYKKFVKSCWQIKIVITKNLGQFQLVSFLAYNQVNLI